MFALLLISMAWADETTTTPTTPTDTAGIVQVPAGSTVTPPVDTKLKPFVVPQFSYLLPEPMYDQALIKAKQLSLCQPALDKAVSQTMGWIDVSQKALDACSVQFGTDTQTIEELRKQVVDLNTRAVGAETKLHDVKAQRNVAWAVTTGLVLGAVAVTAVAIGT